MKAMFAPIVILLIIGLAGCDSTDARLDPYPVVQPQTAVTQDASAKPTSTAISAEPVPFLDIPENQSATDNTDILAGTVSGAGSTVIQRLLFDWEDRYVLDTGILVGYIGVGSGTGEKLVGDGVVDFCCTDTPLDQERLKGCNAIQFPLVASAVVAAYNIPGIADKEPLRFDGPLLADIFSGEITDWDDRRIQQANPQVRLPALKIKVVYRSDASGSSFVFSEFLSQAGDGRWASAPSKKFPEPKNNVGIGAWGSTGVARFVGRQAGAIGYVELRSAHVAQLGIGTVLSGTGTSYVAANEATVGAAAKANLKDRGDLEFASIVNAKADDAYPIAAVTWAVIRKDLPGARKGLVIDFFHWVLSSKGQRSIPLLFHGCLPENIGRLSLQQLDSLK